MKSGYPYALLWLIIQAAAWADGRAIIEADWLYLTQQSAWIQHSTSLSQGETIIPLPVKNLSPQQLWWQNSESGRQVSWQRTQETPWLEVGQDVQVDGWQGAWQVVHKNSEALILQQETQQRWLPKPDWQRLAWSVSDESRSSAVHTLLRVVQEAMANTSFQYAWLETGLSGQVRYELDLSMQPSVLRQQFLMSNRSGYDIKAPGYSFSQQSVEQHREPVPPQAMMEMARTTAREPELGASNGQAVLISRQPIFLAADSALWLLVQSSTIGDIQHHYQFNWNVRSSDTQTGQWFIHLETEQNLPAMAGPLNVAFWDEQLSVLPTQYQPQQQKKTRLAMGASDMLTLNTEPVKDNQWRLTFSNRNDFDAIVQLDISQWLPKERQEQRLSGRYSIPANGEVQLLVTQNNNRLVVEAP